MNAKIRVALAALAIVVTLTGCLQFETVVSLQRDGSGTVTQTFIMNNQILMMLAGMAAESGDEEFSLLDEAELEAEAEAMGRGVEFVSAEPVQNEWGQGYVAVFSFEDINSLQVNQNPGDNVPESSATADEPIEENLTFEFMRGGTSTLLVRFPNLSDDEDADEAGEVEVESMEGMDEMLRQIYSDMRMTISVEVEGSIVSSNATYQEGNRVTLLDLDFNSILANPEATERLLSNQAESITDLQELAANVPGVKIETNDPVRIRFR